MQPTPVTALAHTARAFSASSSSGVWPRGARLAAWLLAIGCSAVLALPPIIGAHAAVSWNHAPFEFHTLPVVLQRAANDCGPAALATLALWSGLPYGLSEITTSAQLTSDGLTLGEFSRLAHSFGAPGAWFHASTAALSGIAAPFVAHLSASGGAGHLVVVRAVVGKHVLVADPAVGTYSLPLSAFGNRFTGRVYVLEPT